LRVVRQHPAAVHPPVKRRDERASEVAVVALAVLTGLVLAARPANEGSAPVEVAGLPSRVAMDDTPAPPPAPAARILHPPTLRPTLFERGQRSGPDRLQSP
jgi:hypothetical protein